MKKSNLFLAIPNDQEPIIINQLTEAEFDSIKCDSEKIYEYLYYTRRLLEIELNKNDFFSTIESYLDKFKDSINQPLDYKENAFVDINRSVNNFVASFVSFIEHCEEKIKALYGSDSKELSSFKEFESDLYDQYFSYRFLKRIRNYAIHAYYPIEHVSFFSHFDKDTQVEIFELDVLCSRDKLLTSKTLKKKLGKDLIVLDNTFDISTYITEVGLLIKKVLVTFIKIAHVEFLDSAKRLLKLSEDNGQPSLSISKMEISEDYITKHDSKILPIEIAKEMLIMVGNI